MNEEQTTPEKAGNSTIQSGKESADNKVDDSYYAVDKPKKELLTSIGDGEMRNEGTVGMGDVPEGNPLVPEGQMDEQDKAELRDSGS